jgi:hypothetical protein
MSLNEEPWDEVVVSDWSHFDEVVKELPRHRWVFRGHAEASWMPETSLYRAFEDARLIKQSSGHPRRFARDIHERLLIDRFKRSAHLYRTALPRQADRLEWLAIMQHYGAPTRLLDVTLSPQIAMYFAMESEHGDSAIFAFDHARLAPGDSKPMELRRRIFEKQDRSLDQAFIVAFVPKLTTERLLAQQGAFLVPSNNDDSFVDLIRSSRKGRSACKKIVVPAALRFEAISRLRAMNLTSTALFPGIDGFCRSLRFQIFERTQDQKLLH